MARGATSKGRRNHIGRHARPKVRPTINDCRRPKPTRPSDIPIVAKTGRLKSRLGFRDHAEPGEQIEARKREAAAVELRIMGATFTEISEELGYASRGAAFDAYTRGYKALNEELRSEAQDAIRHQLARNISYRKKVLIQGNESGDQIAGTMAALAIDKFDSALRGLQPGSARDLDAVPAIAGPDRTNGAAVCAKCGAAATASLSDPKFEYERIRQINAILIESGVAAVPIRATDDEGWDAKAASATPATSAPQTASPKAPEVVGARFERIKDRELRDLADYTFNDHEIL
jgi:hypothetical protein